MNTVRSVTCRRAAQRAARNGHNRACMPLVARRRPRCAARQDDEVEPLLLSDKPGSQGVWRTASGAPVLRTTLLSAGVGGLSGLFPAISDASSTLQAIAVLGGIVAFHELGHFSAARLQGIHVSRFAIGFGPVLFAFKHGDVEYSLRALPLGGYVAFPDRDEDCPYPEDDPNLLKNRPMLDRFWVISMGVIFNILLAYGCLVAQVNSLGYVKTTYDEGVKVAMINKGSAAERYGLLPGDVILALDNQPVATGAGAVPSTVRGIKAHRDISVDLTVRRNGAIQHVQVLPDIASDGGGRIGVSLQAQADVSRVASSGPLQTLTKAGENLGMYLNACFRQLGSILSNLGTAAESLSGPVAVVATGEQLIQQDKSGLYDFATIVNINLAVVNILPLPGLDGGFLLLLFFELLRKGEKVPEKVELVYQLTGFVFLMGLGVMLLVKDTINILPK